MRAAALAGGFLAGLAAAAAAGPVVEPDPGFGGALRMGLALTDTAGAPIDHARAGAPFRVVATLTDPATGGPVEAPHLSGWIRPVAPGDVSCGEAARAYFATGGSLPRGGTDLGRSLHAIRHADGTVSVVDWERTIASANILAIAPMPGLAGPLAPLSAGFGFIGPAADGGWLRIDAAAGASPYPAPERDDASARALVTAEGWRARGTRLRPPDGPALALPAAAIALSPALPDSDGVPRGVLALLAGGRAVLAHPDGALGAPVAGPPGATDAAYAAGATLFVDGAARVLIDYGPTRIEAPLPAPARRIAASQDGRLALAWSPDSPAVSILDVATGALLQALAPNRAPLDQNVREVALGDGVAVLLLQRLDFVLVIDLALVRRGEPAAARAVRLGPEVADPPASGGPYLVASQRGGAVLALHPGLSTVFPIMRDSGNASAPMNGFRVRGAAPLSLAELPGGFTRAAPGRYVAATVLPVGGAHEVVVSGGPGRFTGCARFTVDGPVAATLQLRLAAVAAPAGGGRTRLDLRLLDEAGAAQTWPADLPLLLQSLDSGWRHQTVAEPAGPDLHRVELAGLPPGEISVAFDRALPPAISVAPTTFEAP